MSKLRKRSEFLEAAKAKMGQSPQKNAAMDELEDLVASLEDLHRSGEMSDAEYRQAKAFMKDLRSQLTTLESVKRGGDEATEIYCNECGKKFKKKITSKTIEIKCPKCGSYDTELSEYFGH